MCGLPTNEMRLASEMEKNGHGFRNTDEGVLPNPEGFNNSKIAELAFSSVFSDQIYLFTGRKAGV
jgi:hypothetical protein